MDVTGPDVKQIVRAQTQLRPSAARAEETDNDFAIVIVESTWKAMQEHAHSRTDAEVGGVMLGKLCRDARETPYLLIDGHVAALEAESRASNVTFTAESWTKIHEVIDRDFPGAQIVGWYHTHPSFGIFLSEMDVFIQRHFFDAPQQVAIVIDPVADTHGGFSWRNGVPVAQKLVIEPDSATGQGVDLREVVKRRMIQREAELNAGRSFARSLARVAIWLLTLLVVLAACCYAMVKWTPLGSRFRDLRGFADTRGLSVGAILEFDKTYIH